MPYTPAWILYITGSSGYQVDVAMKDRLPGRLARIRADIESTDVLIAGGQQLAGLPKQIVAREEFRRSQIEIVGSVSFWHNQRVPLSDGKCVPDRVHQLVREEDSLLVGLAEDARRGRQRSSDLDRRGSEKIIRARNRAASRSR